MKVINAIICDQALKEDNGKHILIGVYPIDILADFPAMVSLVAWVQLELPGADQEILVEYRVLFNKSVVAAASGSIATVRPNMLATTVLPPVPIELTKKGILKFQIREQGGRWKTLKMLHVKPKDKKSK